MDDEQFEQLLGTLVGIGSELHHIKQELRAYNGAVIESQEHDEDAFVCKCGSRLADEHAAERHAVEEHHAPGDVWQEMFVDA